MRTKGAVSHTVVTLRKLNQLLKPGAKIIVSKLWADVNVIPNKPIDMALAKKGLINAN